MRRGIPGAIVDQISDIYHLNASEQKRRARIERLIKPLLAAANRIGKHTEIIRCSYDGFDHRQLDDWFPLIWKASESV